MQTIAGLFSSGGGGDGMTLADTMTDAPSGASAAGGTAGLLNGLRFGTSLVSGLSAYGAGRAQKIQDDLDAQSEQMAGSAALIDAQQKSTAIMDQYNQTVADQLAVASASGYDVASGSVVAARQYAQGQADRAISVVQSNGNVTAALRQARAYALKAQGDQAETAGLVSGLTQGAQGLMSLLSMAGPAALAL